MNWIWENYSPRNSFIINQKIDPYSEILPDCSDNIFYVNVLMRFGNIFSMLSDENLSEKNNIFNIAVHFLAHQDMLNGLDFSELCRYILRDEIKNNIYGTEIKNLFFSDCVTEKEQDIILDYFLEYRLNHENENLFGKIFLELFKTDSPMILHDDIFAEENPENNRIITGFIKPFPEIYYDNEKNIYYYYCGNNLNKNKFRLLRLMFSDVSENISDIYGKCFGVIGEEDYSSASCPEVGNFRII